MANHDEHSDVGEYHKANAFAHTFTCDQCHYVMSFSCKSKDLPETIHCPMCGFVEPARSLAMNYEGNL